eukprot:maker-scaffold412_size179788-snap-gene-0.24 protein:Tk11837 transcript:maker-scaffold412_size179788-snap-gene-0.24-mRNA-1 annotation:"achain crystal structure of the thrombospondin-1 type 1 repeats"
MTCGSIVIKRSRKCEDPDSAQTYPSAYCGGADLQETQDCNLPACPIDGSWSPWQMDPCPVTCGGTFAQRHRTCSNPTPSPGGQPCLGGEIENVQCGSPPCPPGLQSVIATTTELRSGLLPGGNNESIHWISLVFEWPKMAASQRKENGRSSKRRSRANPDLYRDMSLPKACGILGLRDREFRDGNFELIHSAFTRKVSSLNPEESGSTKTKLLMKNQMLLHEAYQFLLKRKTSQLEQEALEAERKRRKHLEEEKAHTIEACDDTEAILNAAHSERSRKFDSSGSLQSDPLKAQFNQDQIVSYLDKKSAESQAENLIDKSLDRAGYARIVKKDMRGCSLLYVLIVAILNQVADGRYLDPSRPMTNAPMAGRVGINRFINHPHTAPIQMPLFQAPRLHPFEVVHHPMARRSSSAHQLSLEDEEYLMDALLEGLEFEKHLKQMLEPGYSKVLISNEEPSHQNRYGFRLLIRAP